MGRAENSIVIKAPPDKVWEMLAFNRIQEWDKGCGEGLGEDGIHFRGEHSLRLV